MITSFIELSPRSSVATFNAGAAHPLVIVLLAPAGLLVEIEAGGSLLFLALLGAIGVRAGGALVFTGTLRVTFWGALAMALTAGIRRLVGTAV
jgi:VIT1/CCC1 family predicted Fe2+/Mn2+ transporter